MMIVRESVLKSRQEIFIPSQNCDAIHGPGGAMKYEELDPIGIEEREAVDDDSDGDDPKIELVDMAKPSSEAAV